MYLQNNARYVLIAVFFGVILVAQLIFAPSTTCSPLGRFDVEAEFDPYFVPIEFRIDSSGQISIEYEPEIEIVTPLGPIELGLEADAIEGRDTRCVVVIVQNNNLPENDRVQAYQVNLTTTQVEFFAPSPRPTSYLLSDGNFSLSNEKGEVYVSYNNRELWIDVTAGDIESFSLLPEDRPHPPFGCINGVHRNRPGGLAMNPVHILLAFLFDTANIIRRVFLPMPNALGFILSSLLFVIALAGLIQTGLNIINKSQTQAGNPVIFLIWLMTLILIVLIGLLVLFDVHTCPF